MNDVSLLLVPITEDDPGGLLASVMFDTVEAARPPILRQDYIGRGGASVWAEKWSLITYDMGGEAWPHTALPIWLNGSLVPEAWDRARRIYEQNGGSVLSHPATRVMDLFNPTLEQAIVLAAGLKWKNLAIPLLIGEKL